MSERKTFLSAIEQITEHMQKERVKIQQIEKSLGASAYTTGWKDAQKSLLELLEKMVKE